MLVGFEHIEIVLSGAAFTALLDGLHQIAFAMQIVNGVGQIFVYAGVQIAASGTYAMTQFNQLSNPPAFFGFAPGAGASLSNGAAGNTKWGRPAFHDLTSRSDLSFANLLARDIEAAAGYLA